MKSQIQIIRDTSEAIKASGEKKSKGYFAMMGNLAGTVLTGSNNIVYVTTLEGQVRTVINRRVPNVAGDVVFVGMDDYSANRIEVLYSLNPSGSTSDGSAYEYGTVPPHSHSYDSVNPTWVQAAQFLPLLVLPYSGQTVQVFPGAFLTSAGAVKWYAGEILDLSGYFPGSGALWVIIQIDDDASASVVAGTAAASRSALTYADIPDATTGKRIVAVILEAGFNSLFRSTVQNDFLDLRFFALDSGALDAADLLYTPAVPSDWDYASDPGDVADALDQLAERVTDLEVAPSGQYRQLVYIDDGAGSWEFLSFDDGSGNDGPVTILTDLE